jgi:UPF0755 protein
MTFLFRAKVLASLFGAMALWGFWVLADGNRPYLRSMTPTSVEIAPGTSTWLIAQQLEDAGAIRSSQTFLFLHYLRAKQTLKAGEYSFDYPASTQDVLRKLVLGEASHELLTVPEGFNRFEIADLVEAGGFATREEFLKASADAKLVADLDAHAPNLEGYLFPDTYQFPRHIGAARIVRVMVNRFRQVYSGLAPPDAERPAREIVIMASLVEAETGKPEERPLVASVFYNRLKRNIPLQCDPTVVYAAVLNHSYDGQIRQSQLNFPSPYNTYLHPGLPPGPIANPGKASLLAALHPVSSKYLYFVANPAGHHTFSRTLAEHNLAVSMYRRNLSR